MPQDRTVLVIGAASQIGYHLLPRLADAGWSVAALSRTAAPADHRGASWHRVDVSDRLALGSIGLRLRSVINLAPIRILPALVHTLADLGVTRIIAFSSTSRFTKAQSADPDERALAATLARSEEALAHACITRGIAWTVFLPTLVYSPGLDRNVSEIARFVQRLGFFPIVADGRGKRQPVHAADLAAACVAALDEPKTFDRAYCLSGGETLTYREMVHRIFGALSRPARILSVPPGLFKAAVNAARLVPRFRKLSAELVTRMNMDMCFDHGEATHDFGFSPRKFEFRLDDGLASAGLPRSGFAR